MTGFYKVERKGTKLEKEREEVGVTDRKSEEGLAGTGRRSGGRGLGWLKHGIACGTVPLAGPFSLYS